MYEGGWMEQGLLHYYPLSTEDREGMEDWCLEVVSMIYSHFVNYRFVYTLNTKTYSWLTKPKTLKLNAKTGGALLPS